MENTKFKVYIEEKTQDYGRIFIEPLERGYGDTLGNALRRLLLSSIRGAAVIAVNIDGILHEFSTIEGVREDVLEILMNLKRIPIRAKNKDTQLDDGYKVITLDSDELPKDFFTREINPGTITAMDMPKDHEFEFCGDGVLCTLEPGAHLVMEIYVQLGTGYLSAERERPSQPSLPINALLTDAIFSPVKRVNYQIVPARVGQTIDYDKLLLEVWTNGAIKPEEAVEQASRIAEDYFKQIAETVISAEVIAPVVETKPDIKVVSGGKGTGKGKPKKPAVKHVKIVDNRPIQDLNLSIRSVNCLRRDGVETVGDLINKSRDELLKIPHLGKKSLDEIDEKLEEYGLTLSPYPSENAAAVEVQWDTMDFTNPKPANELVDEIMKDTADSLKNVFDEEEEKEKVVDATVDNSELLPGVFDESETEPEISETFEEEPVAKTKKVKVQKEKKTKTAKKSDKPAKSKSKVKAEEEKVIEEPVAEEIEEPEEIEAPEIPEAKEPEKPKKSKTAKKVKKAEKAEAVEDVKEPEEVKQEKKEKKSKAAKSKAKIKVEAEKLVKAEEKVIEEPEEIEAPEIPEAKEPEKPKKSSTAKKVKKAEKAEAVEDVKEPEEVKQEKKEKKSKAKTKSKAKIKVEAEKLVKAEEEKVIEEPEEIEALEIPEAKEPEKPKKSSTAKKVKKAEAVEDIKEPEAVKQEKKEKKSKADKKSETTEKSDKPKTKSKTKTENAVIEEAEPKKSKAVKTTKTSSKAAKAEKTKKSDTKSEAKTKKTRKKKE